MAISANQTHLGIRAKVNNQRSLVAISGNQTHLGIRAKVNVRRRFVAAQDAKGAPTASRHKRSTQRHELPLPLTQPSSLCGVRLGHWAAIRGDQRPLVAISGS